MHPIAVSRLDMASAIWWWAARVLIEATIAGRAAKRDTQSRLIQGNQSATAVSRMKKTTGGPKKEIILGFSTLYYASQAGWAIMRARAGSRYTEDGKFVADIVFFHPKCFRIC